MGTARGKPEDDLEATHVLCFPWRGSQTRAGSARKGCGGCPAEAASGSAQTDKTGQDRTGQGRTRYETKCTDRSINWRDGVHRDTSKGTRRYVRSQPCVDAQRTIFPAQQPHCGQRKNGFSMAAAIEILPQGGKRAFECDSEDMFRPHRRLVCRNVDCTDMGSRALT